jgi:hypothetical protein
VSFRVAVATEPFVEVGDREMSETVQRIKLQRVPVVRQRTVRATKSIAQQGGVLAPPHSLTGWGIGVLEKRLLKLCECALLVTTFGHLHGAPQRISRRSVSHGMKGLEGTSLRQRKRFLQA